MRTGGFLWRRVGSGNCVAHASLRLAVCVGAILIGAACAPESATRPWQAAMPLDSGTRWVYRTEFVDPTLAEPWVRPESVLVLGDTTAFGEEWTKVAGNPFLVAGTIHPQQYLALRPGGIWHASELERDDFSPPSVRPGGLALPYPPELNRWVYSSLGAARAVELDAEVVVPAGRFTCVRYDLGFGAWLCLAPGVGIVAARSSDLIRTDNVTGVTDTLYSVAELTAFREGPGR
jgi:hypothetical protein